MDEKNIKPDFVVVSSSGGKDSVCSLAVAAEVAAELGAPLVVVHADMGRMEWKGSLELVEEQATHWNARLIVVSRGNGDLLAQAVEKGVWPRVGMKTCQGTSDHKRGPIWTSYTALAKEWRDDNPNADRPCRILEVIGLAGHESGSRKKRLSKMQESEFGGRYERNVRASNGRREVVSWYPIADWSLADVWDRMAKETLHGAPEAAWAYSAGMPRYSCTFCVFAERDALNRSAQLNPVMFQEYLAAEKLIGPWRKEFTLADIAADLEAGHLVESATEWGDQA